MAKKPHTIPRGSGRQSQAHVGRRHECVFRHIHGPHEVMDVDQWVELCHLLWGDNFTRYPHYTATEQKKHPVTSPAGELVQTEDVLCFLLIRTSATKQCVSER